MNAMHAVIRMYAGAGAKQLVDLLEARKTEVEALIRPVKGFVSYSCIRTADGGAMVTVCEDKAGTDGSLRVAREWDRQECREPRRKRTYRVGRSGNPAFEVRSLCGLIISASVPAEGSAVGELSSA